MTRSIFLGSSILFPFPLAIFPLLFVLITLATSSGDNLNNLDFFDTGLTSSVSLFILLSPKEFNLNVNHSLSEEDSDSDESWQDLLRALLLFRLTFWRAFAIAQNSSFLVLS